MVKYRRVYDTKLKKMAIAGVSLLFILFILLVQRGDITVTGYSGDMQCAGTEEDPCIAYINFTANIDVFIYPFQEEWSFGTDKLMKEIKVYRSWGTGWRYINFSKGCTGSWCGCYWCSKTKLAEFAYVFRQGRNYSLKIVGYKNIPFEDIKWSFGTVDPMWNGVNITYELISNTDQCFVDCSLKFRFKIDKNYTIDNLNKFKPIFKKAKGALNLSSWGYKLRQTEKYNDTEWSCNPYNETIWDAGNSTWVNITHPNCSSTEIEKTRYVWKKFNPIGKTIKSGKWYYIELWGKKKIKLGENNVDAVPTIGNFEFPFAWWNSSFCCRYPIYSIGTIAGMTIIINDTRGIGVPDNILATLNCTEQCYVYCENSDCATGLIGIANETDEKYWANDSAILGGNEEAKVFEPENMLLRYGFGNKSGSTVFDFSARRINATTNGDPVWNSSGVFGYGMTFDGNGDYLLSSGWKTENNFTITFWARHNDSTTASRYCVLGNTLAGGYLAYFCLGWDTAGGSCSSAAGCFHINMYRSGDVSYWLNFSRNTNWNHYAIVKDETNLSLWQNGTYSGSQTVALNEIFNLTKYIARQRDGYYFNGSLDEFRVYNRSLSKTEIQEMYYNGKDSLTSTGAEEIYLSLNYTSPTLDNESYTNKTWIYVNVSKEGGGNLSTCELEWTNSSGTENISMTVSGNYSYNNMTGLTIYEYHFRVYCNNTNDDWAVTGMREITTATISFEAWNDSSGSWVNASLYDVEFWCFENETDCPPIGQSALQSIYRFRNIGSNNVDTFNGSLAINMSLTRVNISCDDTADPDLATNLTTSYQTICDGSLPSGSTFEVWCWADFGSPDPPEQEFKILNNWVE